MPRAVCAAVIDAEGGVGGVELSDPSGEGLDGGSVGVHEGWECDDAICTKRPKTMCGEMERSRSQTH